LGLYLTKTTFDQLVEWLPHGGSQIRQVLRAPDGGMLITTSTIDADDQARIYVVSPSGVAAG
jgi:hypothetical protein